MIVIKGDTVESARQNLVEQFPDMKPELFDKGGNLTKKVEIYLNMESAYPDELTKPVKDGDDIHLTLLLAGG